MSSIWCDFTDKSVTHLRVFPIRAHRLQQSLIISLYVCVCDCVCITVYVLLCREVQRMYRSYHIICNDRFERRRRLIYYSDI